MDELVEQTPIKVSIENSDLLRAFNPGDLLYGLEKEAREPFREDIEKKLLKLGVNEPYITIDDINNILFPAILNNTELKSPNTPPQQYDKLVASHLHFWKENPKYDPSKIKDVGDARDNRAIIYSCKVALLSHAQKIHFCLDHFQSEAIRDDDHEHHKSFTAKELRLCVKNWELIKNRVIFYHNGMICSPPWGNERPLDWFREKNMTKQMDDLCLDDSSFKTPAPHARRFFQPNFESSADQSITSTPNLDNEPYEGARVSKKLFDSPSETHYFNEF